MKIRTGFVSNSSSSSFIVAFDRIPSSIEEMKKILFGDKDTFVKWPTLQIAEIVYKDLYSQTPMNYNEIIESSNDLIYIDNWNNKK